MRLTKPDQDYLFEQCELLSVRESVYADVTKYLQCLAAWNAVHNLTAVRQVRDQIEALVVPSLLMYPALKDYRCCLDLGSGSGVPGVILALLQPQQDWILVEKSPKKCSFLRAVKRQLSLDNVQVKQSSFQQLPFMPQVEAIVSRGSGQLPAQLALTQPWRQHGVVLCSVQTAKSLEKNPCPVDFTQVELCATAKSAAGGVNPAGVLKMLIING